MRNTISLVVFGMLFLLVGCNATTSAPTELAPTVVQEQPTTPPDAGCTYIPAALGPGETLYAEADVTSTVLGKVIFNGAYKVVTVALGVGEKETSEKFYELMDSDGKRGWVLTSGGGTLSGSDCAIFQ